MRKCAVAYEVWGARADTPDVLERPVQKPACKARRVAIQERARRCAEIKRWERGGGAPTFQALRASQLHGFDLLAVVALYGLVHRLPHLGVKLTPVCHCIPCGCAWAAWLTDLRPCLLLWLCQPVTPASVEHGL